MTGLFFMVQAACADLNTLPTGFAKEVESGWLPLRCVKQNAPMPEPMIRKWAEHRAGDKIRVLFITGKYEAQYEALSVARAFDFECDVIPLWRIDNNEILPDDPPLWNLLRYYLMTKKYDVIAMSRVWLSSLPDDCEEEIASIIKEKGVGFVYAMPFIIPRVPSMNGKPSAILDPLMPLVRDTSGYGEITKGVEPVGNHPLARGEVFSEIKWLCNINSSLKENATPILKSTKAEVMVRVDEYWKKNATPIHKIPVDNRVLAASIACGKGRIVAYNHAYGEMFMYSSPFLPSGIAGPTYVDMEQVKKEGMGKFCRWLNGFEFENQFYSWLGHSIIWAAQKEPLQKIESVTVKERNVAVDIQNLESDKKLCNIRIVARAPYNTKEIIKDEKCTLLSGKNTIPFVLPTTGMSGQHHLDVYLLDSNNTVIDWSSSIFETKGKLEVKYTSDYKVYGPAETIELSFSVAAPSEVNNIEVHSELFDLEGRLLCSQDKRVNVEGKNNLSVPVIIKLAGTGITSRLANVKVTFQTDGETVELRDQLFIRQLPDWKSFHIGAYADFQQIDPADDVRIKVLKEMGHDTIKMGWPGPVQARLTTETSLRPFASNIIQETPEDMKRLVGWLKDFSTVKYELQDEPELQSAPAKEDKFDSLANKSHFRSWLEKKYSSLAALNTTWGKNYKTWDDVERLLWYEVLDTSNWTAWFDSRRERDNWFLEGLPTWNYALESDAIREASPGSVCSFNPRSITTFSGIDLREWARRVGSANLYNSYVRGAADISYLELGRQWFSPVECVMGYTWPSAPNVFGLTREAWDCARRGVPICWFAPFCEEGAPDAIFSYLNGNLTPNAKGQVIENINKALLSSGTGDMAVNTKPLDEGVFIYYPRSLFYASTLAFMKKNLIKSPSQNPAEMLGENLWGDQLPCSFLIHLNIMGYQYEFGDEQDMTKERLKKTRVVFLPNAICISEEQLKLLRDFVNNGGCVIAQAGVGRRDGEGRIYEKTPEVFKDIFGVERTAPNLSPLMEKEDMKIVSKEVNDKDFSSGEFGQVYKKGKAFLINFVLPAESNSTGLLSKILTDAGVMPTYCLKKNSLAGGAMVYSMVVRKAGVLSYLYLTGDGHPDDDFYIKLPSSMFIYEMVTGKMLGVDDHIEGKIRDGEAKVFALSPSPTKELSVKAGKTTYSRGERVSLDFILTTQDKKPGNRLIMIKWNADKAEFLPDIPRTLMLNNGKGQLQFLIPYNASLGKVELTANDLTSGNGSSIWIKISR